MGVIEIVVTPAGAGNCYAYFKGHETAQSAGSHPECAIGNLIRHHGNLVGVTIVDTGSRKAESVPAADRAVESLEYRGYPIS